MSHSGKTLHEMGVHVHSFANQFEDALNLDDNKPDFKELDLGSPSPPYLTRRVADCHATAGSGTSTNQTPLPKRSDGRATSHSGELLTTPSTPESHRSAAATRNSKPGHRRSSSTGAPLIYSGNASHHNSSSTSSGSTTTTNSGGGGGAGGASGGSGNSASSVSSPNALRYPSGNICPSGKIIKSNMGSRTSSRTDTLGSGTGNYGHGSIVKGSGGAGGGKTDSNPNNNLQFAGDLAMAKRAISSSDPEEVKKAGNELYRRGNFVEALSLYDRAIYLSPENASYRSNRAAALTMLGRLGEAVSECEEAVRLDPMYVRAHHRLASLYLKLGQAENARHHLYYHGQQPDPAEVHKLQSLEKHLNRCMDARKTSDWRRALQECDSALVAGAVSSPEIVACKAEAFLKLHQLEDADSTLSEIPKIEPYPASYSQTKFFGMLSEAYVLYVKAQIDMALGRFENAVAEAETAGFIDCSNIEVAMLLNNVKLVARARARGKDLFNSGRFTEACSAYGEGLKYDLCNSVLYCNRAVCWSKLGLWEQSVDDCNQALKIHPKYTKALLRRAVSNAKLERWGEAVRDYEVLRRELPGDKEVAESLNRAQAALRKSRGEVEEFSSRDHYKSGGGESQCGGEEMSAAAIDPRRVENKYLGGHKKRRMIGSRSRD